MSSVPARTALLANVAGDAIVQNSRSRRARGWLARTALGTVGLVAVVALWWLGAALLAQHNALAAQFSPFKALATLPSLVTEDGLVGHIGASLQRIGVGLFCALLVGVPLGFAIGRIKALETALSPALQFLRMISPLSWMPVAVMALGIGDRPVYFLLAFAAVWPVVMSTAAGVQQIDRRWVQLGESSPPHALRCLCMSTCLVLPLMC